MTNEITHKKGPTNLRALGGKTFFQRDPDDMQDRKKCIVPKKKEGETHYRKGLANFVGARW